MSYKRGLRGVPVKKRKQAVTKGGKAGGFFILYFLLEFLQWYSVRWCPRITMGGGERSHGPSLQVH